MSSICFFIFFVVALYTAAAAWISNKEIICPHLEFINRGYLREYKKKECIFNVEAVNEILFC